MSNKHSTKLISAFPATGKTHFFNNTDLYVMDSDSSTFNKDEFPGNYIQHIKNYIGKVDFILISSHIDVREALVKEGMWFSLVYPDISLKAEYIKRWEDRGSPPEFVKLMTEHWEQWIGQMDEQVGCDRITLESGQYLSDVIVHDHRQEHIRQGQEPRPENMYFLIHKEKLWQVKCDPYVK
jgi:hypothetical protein